MRIRKSTLAALAIAALTIVAGVPSLRAEETTGPARLRIMTYNIHHGRGTDNKINLERIASVIRGAKPDLVALQEVDIKTSRSSEIDQLAELSRLTKMHGRFGKGRDFEGGDYGQAILSRFPIGKVRVYKLSASNNAEERIAFTAEINGDGPIPDLLFVTTHLHHQDEPLRLEQAKDVVRILKENDKRATILAGDFNAEPDSKVMQHLFKSWKDTTPATALTFSSEKPVKKIDYILLPKGSDWGVSEWKVLSEPVASDHLPVVVEVEL